MPSTPSKSSQFFRYGLTRPAQRSPKSHRTPDAGKASAADNTEIFCLSTVAAYGVIFDFESSATVIGGVRRFMAPREIEVLAALLFAEGGVVTGAEIYRICGFSAPNTANDVVSRFIRRLRSLIEPLGTITPVPGGYRFTEARPLGRDADRK